MPRTFYAINSVASGSNHGSLGDTAPTTATITTGWNVGTAAAATMASLDWGVEVARTTFAATSMPAATINNTLGDCVRTATPLYGAFAAGNWTLDVAVRAVTAGTVHTGRARARLWKGTDPTGAGATNFGTLTTGTTTGAVTSAADQISTVTWSSVAAQTFDGEYLFVQIAWEIVVAGAGTTHDADMRVGSTATKTTAPTFTATTDRPIPINDITKGAGAGGTLSWTQAELTAAGVLQDDIILVQASVEDTTVTWTTSTSGLTLVSQITGTTSGKPIRMVWGWYRATATLPTTIDLTPGAAAVWRSGLLSIWRNIPTTGDPYEGGTTGSQGGISGSATPNNNGFTTTGPNRRIVMLLTNWDGTIAVTPPTGMTEGNEFDSQSYHHAIQASAGATGNKQATLSATDGWAAYIAGLLPPSTASPDSPPFVSAVRLVQPPPAFVPEL